ncbi:MAG: hypothetical protein RJA07_547 [Bacteroidota bacterium]|jgi:hypothetical protein
MSNQTLQNNFEVFKKAFNDETNLNADENMALYIQYVAARFADLNYQLNTEILNQLRTLNSYAHDIHLKNNY